MYLQQMVIVTLVRLCRWSLMNLTVAAACMRFVVVHRQRRQRLYHLRQLRKLKVSEMMLKSFYSATTQRILTWPISTCNGKSAVEGDYVG